MQCLKSKKMTTKQLIGFLMNISDDVAKAQREMDGMIASFRPLTNEEHESIKTLLLGIQTDSGMMDSVRFEHYERANSEMFAVTK